MSSYVCSNIAKKSGVYTRRKEGPIYRKKLVKASSFHQPEL